jgi:hypothetical protein
VGDAGHRGAAAGADVKIDIVVAIATTTSIPLSSIR